MRSLFSLSALTTAAFVALISAHFFAQRAFALTEAATEINKLKKAGVSVAKCPQFIAKQSSGLFTSINTANTICINGAGSKKGQKLLKANKKVPFIYDGKLRGNGFLDVKGEEGDVNTDPFTEVNYAVAIHFRLANALYSASYKLSILDGENGKTLTTALRGKVPAFGWLDWIGAGKFFFKINALPDKEANQPVFDVNMEFMDQYEGFPVSKSEIKNAGLKLVPCPALLHDFNGKKLYSTKGFICSNQDKFEDAGFTAAPINLTTGLFLAQEVSSDIADGAGQGFPFRVLRPTILTYQVDDPAVADGKKGSVDFYLYNLSTGRETLLAEVEGSIASTQTFINLPGDYAVIVKTHPTDLIKYGEIGWEIEVQGSH